MFLQRISAFGVFPDHFLGNVLIHAETVSASPRSSDVQESAGTSEDQGIIAEAIEARWGESGSIPWGDLTDEQKNHLLGSGTWGEFDVAASEVQDELSSDGAETVFARQKQLRRPRER